MSLAAGASGAELELFFISSSLNYHQIMATKDFTQSFTSPVKASPPPIEDLHLDLVPLLVLMANDMNEKTLRCCCAATVRSVAPYTPDSLS